MELLLALDDGVNHIRQPHRPLQRIRNIFDEDDSFLIKRYRMPKHMLEAITLKVRDDLIKNNRGMNISPDVQVACALRVLTEGCFQRPAGDTADVSQPSVSRILQQFCEALLVAYPDAVRFPRRGQTMQDTKNRFEARFGLPDVLGCVDGTHVYIKAPSENEHLYVNRHQRHSLNVQAVCDSDMLFTSVVAKFPGACHDAFVFEQSAIGQSLAASDGELGYLLGDSGYPLRPWLVVPFDERQRDEMTQEKLAFNSRHTKCRSIVERCFGMLKSRYR